MTSIVRSLLAVVLPLAVALVVTAGAADAAPPPPAPVACPSCWHPAVRTSWNLVLSKVPAAPYRDVQMYDIDGFDASANTVASMHAAGIKVVCYIDAGTWENWRPDASQFPAALLGRNNGWPGERWLDIRDVQHPSSALRSILDARMDMCVRKGFDAIDLDNMDGYDGNHTGFPLKAADQLYFNALLANDAHRRSMSVLQKNDLRQIPQLLAYFDGAVNEQCNQYHECTTQQNGRYGYDQYVAAGKPVFQIEYRLATPSFCPSDNAQDFNGARFALKLNDSVFEPCR